MWRIPLRSVLQPIVHASTGQVIGHEALLRGPAGSQWESPAALFAEAKRQGKGHILEGEARRLAVSRLDDLRQDQSLYVNVDPILPQSTPPVVPPTNRIVLEIAETRSIIDDEDVITHIMAWRSQGYRIAIDDYGVGYMGIGTALVIRPDIIKIDRLVIMGVHQDRARRAAVEAILHVTQAMGTIVIAEGVETEEEYMALRDCGIEYMQGYLFGKPQDVPVDGHVPIPSGIR